MYSPNSNSCCATPSAATGTCGPCGGPEHAGPLGAIISTNTSQSRPGDAGIAPYSARWSVFFAILLEHHAGRLPAWLAPVQAGVMPITDRQSDYTNSTVEALKNQGFRAICDLRNEKVGFKIREHTLQRVPYLLVVGDKEVAANLVSVRTRNGKDLGTMTLTTFMERLRIESDSRGRTVFEG